jgi:hypothetical protein
MPRQGVHLKVTLRYSPTFRRPDASPGLGIEFDEFTRSSAGRRSRVYSICFRSCQRFPIELNREVKEGMAPVERPR